MGRQAVHPGRRAPGRGERHGRPLPEGLYGAGVEALQAKRYAAAADYFDQIERDHPYSTWATNAKLMSAYAEYQRNRYTEAIGALDRFIQLHPAHRDIAYAFYLRALCYYEQIADAQRDQRTTEQAMAALQDVVNRFPDTAYARDARLKIDLGRDHLAGKEMNIGRYYLRQGLLCRGDQPLQGVVEDYQTTNHVPEALHRLTEIYLTLGLTERGAEDRRGARLQLPGRHLVQRQLRPAGRGAAGLGAGTRPGSRAAPGTGSSEAGRVARRMLASLAIRDVAADRAAGPQLRHRAQPC